MTRKEFEKRLKRINSNLCLVTGFKSKPVEILLKDNTSLVAKTVFDLVKSTWREGYNYLSLTEEDELKNLLIDSRAFLKGTHLFEESNLKDSITDNHFKDYTDRLAETLKEKNTAYGDAFTASVDEDGLLALKIRLGDKLNRVSSLIKKGELKENDESLEDTLLDLAGYSILGLKYLKEHENE